MLSLYFKPLFLCLIFFFLVFFSTGSQLFSLPLDLFLFCFSPTLCFSCVPSGLKALESPQHCFSFGCLPVLLFPVGTRLSFLFFFFSMIAFLCNHITLQDLHYYYGLRNLFEEMSVGREETLCCGLSARMLQLLKN